MRVNGIGLRPQIVRFIVLAAAALLVLVVANPEPAMAMTRHVRVHKSYIDPHRRALVPPVEHLFVPSVQTVTGVTVPIGQTFGGADYGVNPTSVESDVNSMDGALEVSHTDLRVAGIGVPFVLDRQYNSRDAGTIGAFGPGWSSILDLAVRFSNKGDRAVVFGEDGQQVGFTYNSANKRWTPDPGVRTSLVCSGPATKDVAPATCTVTRYSDGVNWTLSHGLVEDYRTAAHQGLIFGYTGTRISRVTVESTAKKPLVIEVTRNAKGLVTKLKTPTHSVSYSYDPGGNLAAMKDPDGNLWRMSYTVPHLLTGIVASSSGKSKNSEHILTASYDKKTRRVAAASEHLGSLMHDTTFLWSGSGETGRAYRKELMAKNGGKLTRATYADIYSNGFVVEKLQPLGEATGYQYDHNMDLTKVTNPLGSVQTMKYDAFGDELSTSQMLDTAGHRASETFTYDSHHRLTSITQPMTSYLTDKTTNTYNSKGELVSTTASGSGTTKYTYNSHALRASMTDGEGNVTIYIYDAYGNLTGETIKSPSGVSLEGRGPLFGYNEAGQQVLSVPARGNKGHGKYVAKDATRTAYTPDGQESKVTTPGGATLTTKYNAAGVVIESTDPMGHKTTYAWTPARLKGGQGWQHKTTNPAGTTTDVYDPEGDAVSSTPPQPKKTMSKKPAGVVRDVYNADGEVVKTTNGQGVSTTFKRDALGDVLYSSSRGVDNEAWYNLVGWAVNAATTTFTYPPDDGTPGNPVPNTTTTDTEYGLAGQVVAVADTIGGAISYTYGGGDRMTGVQDRSGLTRYSYNDLGDVTSVTSPSGNVTKYAYNGLNHEVSQTIAAQTWTFAYDADGNTVKTVDPDGRTAVYTFDAMNRKTGVTYSWHGGSGNGMDAPAVKWSYNKLGERTQMVDGNGVTKYGYDSQGRLLKVNTALKSGRKQNFSYNYSKPGQFSEIYPDGARITYLTDDAGNLMGIEVPPQKDGSPEFDTGNMLPTTSITAGAFALASAAAVAAGSTPLPPGGTLYPDKTLGYTFNQPQNNAAGTPTLASGQAFYSVSAVNATNASNPMPPEGAYVAESDLNGNLLGQQWATLPDPNDSNGTEMTMTYGYNGGTPDTAVTENGAGGVQLTSWTSSYQTAQGTDTQQGGYSYNGDGNPTQITAGSNDNLSWNLSYKSSGEIDSVSTNAPNPSDTNAAPVFAYDRAGDMREAGSLEPSRTTLQTAGINWTFLYNNAGQLAKATDATGLQITYAYDGDGNLVSESETGTTPIDGSAFNDTISLIWDPRPETPQLAEAIARGTNLPTTDQRYFWANGPVGMEEDGQAFIFHDDENGTPTMITNTDGQTLETSFYDPDGNFLDGFDHLSTYEPLIGFDGSFTDRFTGLDFMGSRWYDPGLGIFTSRGTPTPPTPGSSLTVSESTTADTNGMSTSAGTSPVSPVGEPPASYGFAAQNPTNDSEPTGTLTAPGGIGTEFKGLGQGAYSLFETVKPYALGTLGTTVAIAPGKALWKLANATKTQTPNAAEQSANGTEVAGEGSTAPEEASRLATAGNDAEEATGPLVAGAESSSKIGLGGAVGTVLTVGAMAAAVYQTVEICGEYGSTSTECIGQAVGTAVSFAAQLVCDYVTAGVASAGCGVLQNVLYTVIPLFITGNGQALLDSVTFSSGFNIQDANVLTAQYLIALTLGPIGVAALLGEVIYANWGAISNSFVVAGDAIASSLATAGAAFVNGLETSGAAFISGISTAGAYFASGFATIVSELVSEGFTNLASQLSNLASEAASQIDNIVGSVGSEICDVVSTVSCWASSFFIVRANGSIGVGFTPRSFAFMRVPAYRP